MIGIDFWHSHRIIVKFSSRRRRRKCRNLL